MNGKLYTRAHLKTKWVMAPNVPSEMKGVALMQSGSILGVDINGKLHTRANLHATWVPAQDLGSKVKAVTIMKDGNILGVGMDNKLYTRSLKSLERPGEKGKQKTNLDSYWMKASVSSKVYRVAIMKDGSILGVGMDNKLYTRTNLEAEWVIAPNYGEVKGITVMRNGTILGIGMNGRLLTRANLNTKWLQTPNVGGHMIGITVMTNDTILGVGSDNKLWTRVNLSSEWVKAPEGGVKVTDVAIMKDGTILGSGLDRNLYTRADLNAKWVAAPDMGGNMKAITVMQDGAILGVGMGGNLYIRRSESHIVRIVAGDHPSFNHRMMICHAMSSNYNPLEWGPDSKKKMNYNGWSHTMEFFAFAKKKPGTIRIAVARKNNPSRLMFNHSDFEQSIWDSGKKLDLKGWMHMYEFWAYPSKQPGTIRIAVGISKKPNTRILINHKNYNQKEWNSGKKMNVGGWKHHMEFWAYPNKKTMTFYHTDTSAKVNTIDTSGENSIVPSQITQQESEPPKYVGKFIVVAGGQVIYSSNDLEACKDYLMAAYERGASKPPRMICEVENGVVNDSPHTVGGQSQSKALNAGFNRRWNSWAQIRKMNAIAQAFVDAGGEVEPSRFLVVAGDTVVHTTVDIRSCMKYLENNYASGVDTPQRMIVEAVKGVVNPDPSTVAGLNQAGGLSAGFNKYWLNWQQIRAMNAVAQKYIDQEDINDADFSPQTAKKLFAEHKNHLNNIVTFRDTRN